MMTEPAARVEARPRILVIDDEPDVCETLDEILTSVGYAVCTAQSGVAALARARAEMFDLVITDLRMPGMSGVDTVAALRQLNPGVPVIVMSGYVSTESAERCAAEGKVRIVEKPVQLDDLLHVVDVALHEITEAR